MHAPAAASSLSHFLSLTGSSCFFILIFPSAAQKSKIINCSAGDESFCAPRERADLRREATHIFMIIFCHLLCQKKRSQAFSRKKVRERERQSWVWQPTLLAALATRLWGNANRRVKHNTESHRPWQHGLFVRLIREYAAKLVSATFCLSQNAAETGNWLAAKTGLVYWKFWHVYIAERARNSGLCV